MVIYRQVTEANIFNCIKFSSQVSWIYCLIKYMFVLADYAENNAELYMSIYDHFIDICQFSRKLIDSSFIWCRNSAFIIRVIFFCNKNIYENIFLFHFLVNQLIVQSFSYVVCLLTWFFFYLLIERHEVFKSL